MADDSSDQPLLPFEPALQLVKSGQMPDDTIEVSSDAFADLLFQELSRRSAAMRDRQQKSA